MDIIIPENGILSKSQTGTFKRMLIRAKIQENLHKLFKKLGLKTLECQILILRKWL